MLNLTLNSIQYFLILVTDLIYPVPSGLLPWLGVPTTYVITSPASKTLSAVTSPNAPTVTLLRSSLLDASSVRVVDPPHSSLHCL
jgi:hypothetical protein